MARKKIKSVSFDAMVKFFMQSYDIPTKKNLNKLIARLDRIETMLQSIFDSKRRSFSGNAMGKASFTASDEVLKTIKSCGKNGATFADIQEKTGFNEKKIRNIIYRMDKKGKITRKKRGLYIVSH